MSSSYCSCVAVRLRFIYSVIPFLTPHPNFRYNTCHQPCPRPRRQQRHNYDFYIDSCCSPSLWQPEEPEIENRRPTSATVRCVFVQTRRGATGSNGSRMRRCRGSQCIHQTSGKLPFLTRQSERGVVHQYHGC